MEQIGTVEQIFGDRAIVAVSRTSSCGANCAHCRGGCAPSEVHASVTNLVGAKIGDVVKIETNTADVLRASLVLYFVPCLLAIFGAVTAENLFHGTVASAACAGGAFFASFAAMKRFEQKMVPVSEITGIMKEAKVNGKA